MTNFASKQTKATSSASHNATALRHNSTIKTSSTLSDYRGANSNVVDDNATRLCAASNFELYVAFSRCVYRHRSIEIRRRQCSERQQRVVERSTMRLGARCADAARRRPSSGRRCKNAQNKSTTFDALRRRHVERAAAADANNALHTQRRTRNTTAHRTSITNLSCHSYFDSK
jgi:hypothetical protein